MSILLKTNDLRHSMAKSKDSKGSCRIRHKLAGMAVGVSLLVDGNGSPGAGRGLMRLEPCQTFSNVGIAFWHSDSLENMEDEASGIAVGGGFLGGAVASRPLSE